MFEDFLSRPKIIPEGTQVVCSHCGKHILTLLLERESFDTIRSQDFEVVGDFEINDGAKMVCFFCGGKFYSIEDSVHLCKGVNKVYTIPLVSGGL